MLKVLLGYLFLAIIGLARADGEVSSLALASLQDLYLSTHGDLWIWDGSGSPWDFSGSPTPCSSPLAWEGVLCDCPPSGVCEVFGLILSGHGLQGPLPSTLSGLEALAYLYLDSNQLTGTVPVLGQSGLLEWSMKANLLTGALPAPANGELQLLRMLDLGLNHMTGSIDSLLLMPSLRAVYLQFNHLTGTIPSAIASLTDLGTFVLQANQITGTIPESIGDMFRLRGLFLDVNMLTGTVPQSIGRLWNAQQIRLSSNHLSGTIPAVIGQLNQLAALWWDENHFTGSIPDEIGSLLNLQELCLQTNRLTGTIPTSLGQLAFLGLLQLQQNQLTGSIPESFGGLNSLQQLLINSNQLTGPIPEAFSNLSNAQLFNLGYNHLNGTLPEFIGRLSQLQVLSLDSNQFTGTIPNAIGNLTNLSLLSAGDNALTGTLPSSIGGLLGLQNLVFDNNALKGTIPASYSALTNVFYISFSINQLTGTFPEYVCQFPAVYWVGVGINAMTGTIPSCVSNMTSLAYIVADANSFHGRLPDLSKLTSMVGLLVNDNAFTGVLPDLRGFHQLTQASLQGNAFHSTIPATYGTLPLLSLLYLDHNQLTGTLPHNLISGPMLTQLRVDHNRLQGNLSLDVSFAEQFTTFVAIGNQLTGAIPDDIFALPRLTTFAVSSNCLERRISPSICNATTLVTLVYDGLHTATSCRQKIVRRSSVFDAYFLPDDNERDTIPSCLYSMPQLVTLHLSSIGLRGSLPDDIVIGESLADLSLSHNHLDGTLPVVFQNRSWTNLDLSFNYFRGHLSKSSLAKQPVNSITSLSLQVNKLSGHVPGSMKQVTNISMLDGNLFACDYENDQLPQRDDAVKTYSCGSNSFNASYYTWLATIVLIALLTVVGVLLSELLSMSQSEQMGGGTNGAIAFHSVLTDLSGFLGRQHTRMCALWVFVGNASLRTKRFLSSHANLLPALRNFSNGLDDIWTLCKGLLIYMLVVLVPVYVTASIYYGTYQDTYAWALSIAYQGGDQPGAMQLVVLLVFLGLLVVSLYEPWQPHGTVKESKDVEMVAMESVEVGQTVGNPSEGQPLSLPTSPPHSAAPLPTSSSVLYLVCAVIILVNLILVGGINALFAYVSIYGTNEQVFLMQIALAAFAFVWNSDRIQWLSTELISWYCDSKSLLSLKHSKYFDSAYLLQLHAKEMAEQHEMLHLQLWIAVVNVVWIPCIVTAALSSSCFYYVLRSPPQVDSEFHFETCSTVDQSNNCLVSEIHTTEITFDPPFSYSYQCSSVLLTYYAPSLMYTCITDGLLSPVVQLLCAKLYLYCMQFMGNPEDTSYVFRKFMMWMKWRVVPDLLQPLDAEDGHAPEYAGQTFVSSQGLMVTLITYVAVLMTFGVVFPPLGVALVVTVIVYIAYHRWMLGKFLLDLQALLKKLSAAHVEEGQKPMEVVHCNIFDALALECSQFPKILQTTKWILVTTSCWFYALFMADTIGYEHGTTKAYWVIVFMALVPLAFFGADYFAGYALQSRRV